MNGSQSVPAAAKSSVSPLWQGIVERALEAVVGGTVVLESTNKTATYGSGQPVAHLRIHDPACFRHLVLGGSVGAGESYMARQWDCGELVDLVRILVRNRDALAMLDGPATGPATLLDALRHVLRRNSRSGSRRNIREHYDLGNDFFRLFLDERMMYSAAVYDTGRESLDAASTAKLDRLCRKLRLGDGDRLLEIGTGWGGLAIHAAENYGCHVTSCTISRAQYDHARALVAARGLTGQVDILFKDYRDLTGRYDKLVSVEMVEAVGHDYLQGYFRACANLLRGDGLMALQAIVIRDARYRRALRKADFIKKHIFPGGFIPSVSVLANAAARADLSVVNLEDFATDYALTLKDWRHRLDANAGDAAALGFGTEFLRMWRFYFAYCEGGFRERAISDVQMLFTMPGYRGRPWRATS